MIATIRSMTSPGIQRIKKNASSETMNSVGMIRTTRLMM